MTPYTMYKCDYCDFTSSDCSTTEAHEAAHFNLSVNEFREWKSLRTIVRFNEILASKSQRQINKLELEESKNELTKFEKLHKISDRMKLENELNNDNIRTFKINREGSHAEGYPSNTYAYGTDYSHIVGSVSSNESMYKINNTKN